MKSRIVSPGALSLLFGAAFVGDALALDPVVNSAVSLPADLSTEIAVTDNNNNNNNIIEYQMAGAAKPSSLRQLNEQLRLS